MTHEEKGKLKAAFVAMSLYYSQPITDTALLLYVEDLQDLPLDSVINTLSELRMDPKTNRIPLPAIIRDRIAPGSYESDEDLARDAAGRILSALSKFGHTNPERAREYIGELGWEVVDKQGGWLSICQRVTDDEIPIYQAQWRDLAKVIRRRAKAGTLNQPPGLYPIGNNSGKKLLSSEV